MREENKMRKQIDFDVHVYPLGNGANETMTRVDVARDIRENYLLASSKDGSYWEVQGASSLQVSAGVIYYQVTFIKYLDADTGAKVAIGSK